MIGSPGQGSLLVGGTTNYDTNLTALDAVMAEWASAASYATRVNALLNGAGSNGNYLLGATQFTNNGGGNTLLGNSPGDDLYYGIEARDTNDWQPQLGEDFIQNPAQVSFQINAQMLSEPMLLLDGSIPVYSNQPPAAFEVAPGKHTLSALTSQAHRFPSPFARTAPSPTRPPSTTSSAAREPTPWWSTV